MQTSLEDSFLPEAPRGTYRFFEGRFVCVTSHMKRFLEEIPYLNPFILHTDETALVGIAISYGARKRDVDSLVSPLETQAGIPAVTEIEYNLTLKFITIAEVKEGQFNRETVDIINHFQAVSKFLCSRESVVKKFVSRELITK